MQNQPSNSENTITTLFIEILLPMSAKWKIYEQTTQPLVENKKKPDAIIRTVERYPMAVEVKLTTSAAPTKQAKNRHMIST